MINFATPSTTDNYLTGFVPGIQGNQTALGRMLDSTHESITGTIPTYTKRYNRPSNYIEEYNGTVWGPLVLNITGNANTATNASNLLNATWASPPAIGVTTPSSGNFTSLNCTLNFTTAGTIVATGNITAFSDARLKTNWKPLETDFLEKLANVQVGTYDRLDTKEHQVGVSAQSLQEVMPSAVVTSENGLLSVAYGNAALAACIMLAKEVVALRKELRDKQ